MRCTLKLEVVFIWRVINICLFINVSEADSDEEGDEYAGDHSDASDFDWIQQLVRYCDSGFAILLYFYA